MAIVCQAPCNSALPLTVPLTMAEAVSFRAELEKSPSVALTRDILRTLSERAAGWGVVHASKIWVTVKFLRTSEDKVVGKLAAGVTNRWKATATNYHKEVAEKKKKGLVILLREDKTKMMEEEKKKELRTSVERALYMAGHDWCPYWRDMLTAALFSEMNAVIFEGKLPAALPITCVPSI